MPVLSPTLSRKGAFLTKKQLSSKTQTTAQLLWAQDIGRKATTLWIPVPRLRKPREPTRG